MNDIDLAELTFQIQEGGADSPLIRETLVRRYAPELYRLAFHLLPDRPERPDEALGTVAEAFRLALADPRSLGEFGSIRNWLYAIVIRQASGHPRRLRPPWQRAAALRRLALVLRYGHVLHIEDIAEALRTDRGAAHRHLRRGRRDLAGVRRPPAGHAGRAIEDALDEQIAWTEIPDPGHLESCESCRRFLDELQEFEKRYTVELAGGAPGGLPDGAVEGILAHVEDGEAPEMRRRKRLPLREAAWAAGAAAGITVLFFLLNPILSIDPPQRLPTPTSLPVEPLSGVQEPPDYALLESQLALWEPWTLWEEARTIAGDHPATTGMVFMGSGDYAAFGSYNDVVLWDLFGEHQTPLKAHESVVTALAFGGDRWLASGSEDGTVRVWDIIGPKLRYALDGETGPVTSLAFSRDSGQLAVGGNSGIRVWNFAEDGMREISRLDVGFVRNLAFSPRMDLFAAVDRSGTMNLWRLPDFTDTFRIALRQRFNTGISFSPNGSYIATASMDRSVKVFRIDLLSEGDYLVSEEHELSHPTWVSDLAWFNERLLLTVAGSPESAVSEPGKRGVYFWETLSGLPARPPLYLEEDGGILNLQPVGLRGLQIGSYNRAVHILRMSESAAEDRLAHFARAGSSLRPFGPPLLDLIEPVPVQDFPLSFRTALEAFDYAQIALEPLTEGLPRGIVPRGAAYDPAVGLAVFAFTRSFALDHEEWIFLRIRPLDEANPYLFYEDWVGRSARVEAIQFGRYIGEKATGEWLPDPIDGGAEGILRWTDSPLTRFRWQQDGYLFEILSRSEIGTEDSRWTSLFTPIILPLVSADTAGPLIDYTIVQGDTCSDIAARFGTTVGRLVEINGLTGTCIIFAGGTLKVPLPPAFGPAIEADLDCDAVLERLRGIPDPLRPDSELYLGFILEDVPGDGNGPSFDFAPFWTLAVPNVDVDFFDPPALLSATGGCGSFLAITGYGGNGEDSGLRIYRWNGTDMELLLHSRGFLIGEFWNERGLLLFDTRSLDYNQETNACTETITSFGMENGVFVEIRETVTEGLECFSAP